MHKRLLILLTVATAAAHAGTRTSGAYTVTADTADLGGAFTASAHYSNSGGLETVTGISKVSSPAEMGRYGYAGQLTELVSLAVASAAPSIPQGAISQLSGTATLDDGSTSALTGSEITWSAVAYPLSSINALGQLAASPNVYALASGTVTGSYLGISNSTTVQVAGPYAGEGIPDSWFVQYFGLPPNPLAAPGADADGTGQTNLFKYLAGLNPLDGSRFALSIAQAPGQPGQMALTYMPVYSGRTYTLQYSPTLEPPAWQTLTSISSSDNGTTRTVTDLNSGSGQRFYRVQISIP